MLVTMALWPLVMQRWLPDAASPLTSWRGIEILLAHLTFLHHEVIGSGSFAGYVPGEAWAYNSAVWSLSIEAIFYLLLPFLAARFFRRPFVLLAIAWAIELGWRTGVTHSPSLDGANPLLADLFTQIPGYFGMLATGMTAAWIYTRAVRAKRGVYALLRRFAPAIQVAAAAALVASLFAAGHANFGGPYVKSYATTPHDELPAISFALLILATALVRGRWHWLWTNAVSRWLGTVSYGVFLWHLIVIKAVVAWFAYPVYGPSSMLFVALIAFALPLSLALGWISYRCIELPVIRAARAWSRRDVPVHPALEPAM